MGHRPTPGEEPAEDEELPAIVYAPEDPATEETAVAEEISEVEETPDLALGYKKNDEPLEPKRPGRFF